MSNWKTLLFIFSIIAHISVAAMQVTDEIIAIVNNDILLKSDIDNSINYTQCNLDQIDNKLIDNTILRHQILENLIIDQIVLQIGKKLGVEVSNEEINQTIDNIKQQQDTAYNMHDRLPCHGINFVTHRSQVYKEVLIPKVRDHEVYRRIIITPQEVETLATQINNQNYDNTEINLSHILIPLIENATNKQVINAKNLAHSIIKLANDRNSFIKLAEIYNVNQKILKDIRFVGWVRIQELPLVFIKTLSKAQKNDIVGPIRSSIGFHIFRVNDLYKASLKSFTTEVHIRHILLKSSSSVTNKQIYINLKQIADDIKNKKISFSNAAKMFSQDHNSAKNGGDLGWVSIDTYDPIFRKTVMKLKKGQMSKVIYSTLGGHLIELVDVRKTNDANLAKKKIAYSILFHRKFFEELMNWVNEQRLNAYVKILDN